MSNFETFHKDAANKPIYPLNLTRLLLLKHLCPKGWSFLIIAHAPCCQKQCFWASRPPQGFFQCMSPPLGVCAQRQGRRPRPRPCLLNTNQGTLCQTYKERAGIFLISKENLWRPDAFQSFPTPPPSSERKCQSIKSGLIWINIAPNTYSSSASVKGSNGLLDFATVNAFPSKFKYYKEVIYIYLGSW